MMRANHKRKRVTWAQSTEEMQLARYQQEKRKKIALTDGDLQFAKELSIHLKLSLINLIIFKLDIVKKHGRLFAFMTHIDHFLFDWALEHKNLTLINYILENLSESQCFIMVSYKNYTSLNRFIASILQSHNNSVPVDDCTILKAILKIKPVWQTIEIIKNCINHIGHLPNDTIVDELMLLLNNANGMTDISSSDMNCNFVDNSLAINKKNIGYPGTLFTSLNGSGNLPSTKSPNFLKK